jgi:glutathione peroxidase
MGVYDIEIDAIDGTPNLLGAVKGNAALFVNVASKCGLTPQYTALEALHEELKDKGFSVIGFPCNQFGGQEPGTEGEIVEFCSTTYGVTFPLSAKVDVNGQPQHALFKELNTTADGTGHTGDIRWNFEKYVIDRSGNVVARFAPTVAPDAPEVREAIEKALA